MRIRQLTLPVLDVAGSTAFFRDKLELPKFGEVIEVGWSKIRLIASPVDMRGAVHVAFNVPFESFDSASAWLRMRIPLHRQADGSECFLLEGHWQSKSVYFTGPEGAVLELIGRRRLPGSVIGGRFTGHDVMCISEVGLPTLNARRFASEARRTFGIETFGEFSENFVPVGDDNALLIAVDPGMPWFPQRQALPTARGLEAVLDNVERGGTLLDPVFGWKVSSSP